MQSNVPRAVGKASKGPRKPGLSLARLISFMGWLCLLVNSLAFGQATSQATSGSASPQASQTRRAPLSHLYWHFLLHQNHLDKSAAAREQQGKDGNWLRNHY